MTLEEFRDFFARKNDLKGEGNTLSHGRANLLENHILNCHAELEQIEVALWPSSDIPRYAANAFNDYCRGAFSGLGKSEIPALKEAGLLQLRYLTADTRNGVGKAEFF